MPAELSAATRAELDELEPVEVLEVMFEYLAGRHRLLGTGQRKLVAIFDNGRLRKGFFEMGVGRDAFSSSS